MILYQCKLNASLNSNLANGKISIIGGSNMTTEKKKTVHLSVCGDVIKCEVTNMSHDEVLHVLVSAAIDQAIELRRSVFVKCILSGFGFDSEDCPNEN